MAGFLPGEDSPTFAASPEAAEALRRSETRYRTLFDAMDAAVLLMQGPA